MNFYFLVMQFSIAVVLVLLYYYFFEFSKSDNYTKKNIPVDLKFFIETQKINVRKIKYKKLIRILAFINAVDVGIVLLITNLVSNLLLKLLIAIPFIFIVLYASYNFAGYIFKKKGLTIDES